MRLYMAVDVHLDFVVIEGYRVDRPKHIARSAWVDYWQEAKRAAHSGQSSWY